MIPEKNWSESQNKWEKFGKKAKYAVFHGVTREPGNVLKEVETSERVGGGGGKVLQFQVTGMIEWGQK